MINLNLGIGESHLFHGCSHTKDIIGEGKLLLLEEDLEPAQVSGRLEDSQEIPGLEYHRRIQDALVNIQVSSFYCKSICIGTLNLCIVAALTSIPPDLNLWQSSAICAVFCCKCPTL